MARAETRIGVGALCRWPRRPCSCVAADARSANRACSSSAPARPGVKAARHLRALGVGDARACQPHAASARRRLRSRCGAEAIDLDALADELARADAVVCAVASPAPCIQLSACAAPRRRAPDVRCCSSTSACRPRWRPACVDGVDPHRSGRAGTAGGAAARSAGRARFHESKRSSSASCTASRPGPGARRCGRSCRSCAARWRPSAARSWSARTRELKAPADPDVTVLERLSRRLLDQVLAIPMSALEDRRRAARPGASRVPAPPVRARSRRRRMTDRSASARAAARWRSGRRDTWPASLAERSRRTCTVELVEIASTGDRITDVPLADVEGTGFFTATLERALADGRWMSRCTATRTCRSTHTPGLVVAAVPAARARWRTSSASRQRVHVASTLDDAAARRRPAPIGHLQRPPDRAGPRAMRRATSTSRPLRGNVPTRIGRLTAGELDAIVLARAGLVRLGLEAHISEVFPVSVDAAGARPGRACRAVPRRGPWICCPVPAALDDEADAPGRRRGADGAARAGRRLLGAGRRDADARRWRDWPGGWRVRARIGAAAFSVEVRGRDARESGREAARRLLDARRGRDPRVVRQAASSCRCRGRGHDVSDCIAGAACAARPPFGRLARETHLVPRPARGAALRRRGPRVREPIASMPGHARLSPDMAAQEAAALAELGITSVLLFGIPADKDARAAARGIRRARCRDAIRRIKRGAPDAGGVGRRLPLRIHRSRPLRRARGRGGGQRRHAARCSRGRRSPTPRPART